MTTESTKRLINLYKEYVSEHPEPDADGITRLDPIQAVGLPRNMDNFVESIARHDADKLVRIAESLHVDEGYIGQAVFYYTLGQLMKLGEKATERLLRDQIGKMAEEQFGFHGLYQIEKMPAATASINLFVDWDGTLSVENGLRQGSRRFLAEAHTAMNPQTGEKEYNVVVATNTQRASTIDAEVRKIGTVGVPNFDLSLPLEDLLDGIFCVPLSHAYASFDSKREDYMRIMPKKSGKVYNGIIAMCGMDPNKSVVITDVDLDKSADRKYPLATIVVDQQTNAVDWLPIVNFLEELGEGSIYSGIRSLHRYPVDEVIQKPVRVMPWQDEGTTFKFYEHELPAANGKTIRAFTTARGRDLLYLGSIPTSATRF